MVTLSHAEETQKGFSIVIKWKQFRFGSFQIYKPFLVPANHWLVVFYTFSCQLSFTGLVKLDRRVISIVDEYKKQLSSKDNDMWNDREACPFKTTFIKRFVKNGWIIPNIDAVAFHQIFHFDKMCQMFKQAKCYRENIRSWDFLNFYPFSLDRDFQRLSDVRQVCVCSPKLFDIYSEAILRN